ncbi:MAG: hypothetical protein WCH75_05455 [Candidatus Binatia bacterium]
MKSGFYPILGIPTFLLRSHGFVQNKTNSPAPIPTPTPSKHLFFQTVIRRFLLSLAWHIFGSRHLRALFFERYRFNQQFDKVPFHEFNRTLLSTIWRANKPTADQNNQNELLSKRPKGASPALNHPFDGLLGDPIIRVSTGEKPWKPFFSG